MPQRAKLDHDLVYWGPEDVDTLAEGDIAAPDECIRPGAYRWDTEHLRWEPLEPKQVKTAPGAPTLDQAFADVLDAIAGSGIELPPCAAAWRKAFSTTLEGTGR